MTDASSGKNGVGRVGWWIGGLAVVAIAAFFAMRLAMGPGDAGDLARPARSDAVALIFEPGAEQQESSAQLRVAGELDALVVAQPGDVIHVDLTQIPSEGDVRFELDLVDASADGEPRPVRVYRNGRPLVDFETEGLVGDRTRARLSIPASTLREPAKYLIEIRTTSTTHFPIRRYLVEVH